MTTTENKKLPPKTKALLERLAKIRIRIHRKNKEASKVNNPQQS